jgi:23S rRNA (guanosine2251-2'-O)-methyltransferase
MSQRPAHLVFGRHPVLALLRLRPQHVKTLFVGDGADAEDRAAAARAARAGVACEAIGRRQLDDWCEGERHQHLAAATVPFAYADFASLLAPRPKDAPALWVVLDQVQDPRNFGAIVRSAAAFGATAVLVPKDRSSPMTPAALKASAGAAYALPVAQIANLRRALGQLQASGVWLHGLAAGAGQPLREADLKGPVALVVGAEGHGLRPLTQKACDHLVTIPAGGMESLNAATAAAIALYEAACQRGRAAAHARA